MDITDKHSAELDFHKMLEEVKSFLEKFEDKFIDGDEKEVLTVKLNPTFHGGFSTKG